MTPLYLGEGVIHNGVVITRPEYLPSAADLADGDPEAEAAVASDLQAKIDQSARRPGKADRARRAQARAIRARRRAVARLPSPPAHNLSASGRS